MTRRDEIIEMAGEAGAVFDLRYKGEVAFISKDALERFAALVAKAERERCLSCYSPDDTATDWADKIRALKDEASE